MNRTDRLYALVEELRAASPRARSARRLAEHFEVSTRTIERDLLALQQAGVPIWATPGPGGGYAVDPTMTLPPLNFTPNEAVAVAVALAISKPMPFGDAAQAALRKVITAMPAADREGALDLVGRIHLLQHEGQLKRTPVLQAVEQAVVERRVLAIDYEDKLGAVTLARRIEPFGFIGGERQWYLVGWCRLRDSGRSFRLDRIRNAHVTTEPAPSRQLTDVAADIAAHTRRPTMDD